MSTIAKVMGRILIRRNAVGTYEEGYNRTDLFAQEHC